MTVWAGMMEDLSFGLREGTKAYDGGVISLPTQSQTRLFFMSLGQGDCFIHVKSEARGSRWSEVIGDKSEDRGIEGEQLQSKVEGKACYLSNCYICVRNQKDGRLEGRKLERVGRLERIRRQSYVEAKHVNYQPSKYRDNPDRDGEVVKDKKTNTPIKTQIFFLSTQDEIDLIRKPSLAQSKRDSAWSKPIFRIPNSNHTPLDFIFAELARNDHPASVLPTWSSAMCFAIVDIQKVTISCQHLFSLLDWAVRPLDALAFYLLSLTSIAADTVAAVPGQTLCQRPGYGRLYTAHKHIPDDHVSGPPPVSRATNVNPAMVMVPSRAALAAAWGEGPPPGVVGDARHRLAVHHHTFGPDTGLNFPRVAHQPYSNAQHLGTSSRVAMPAKPQHKLKMMPSARHTDQDYLEFYPADPRLWGDEDVGFMQTLADFKLILKFKTPLDIDATEDTEFIFYSQLHQSITQHMADHCLRFSGVPSATFNASMPLASDPDALNAWHAMKLLKLPWTVVALGIKPKAGFCCKLCAAAILWYNFKISALTKAWTSLPDKVDLGRIVYFVGKSIILIVLQTRFTNCSGPAPRHGPLEGPLFDCSNRVPHCCLAFHVQHQLGDLNDFTLTECIPDICPSSNTDNSISLIICQVVQMLMLDFQVLFSATSNPSSNTGNNTVPMMELSDTKASIFLKTDEEAEQIPQIIELSRLTAPGQSSSSVISVSNRRPEGSEGTEEPEDRR
ncbi:hypothetical protein C8R45DRAFT_938997 [Mycena sanguinolenta]|nr:hypothetical protein C8R45DRAFT_938997 [Mycena sanguinolenta]